MNQYLKLSLLTLSVFGCIETSESGTSEQSEAYKKYIETQKKINEGIIKLNIPGTRTLNIDDSFAKVVLENRPNEIGWTISGIKENIFDNNTKNIILNGAPGTGKLCTAQAMAIKSQTPCILVNAGSMTTEQADSGVKNLNKIFEHAKNLEKSLDKPCIIILNELDELIKKAARKDIHENPILKSFKQELDGIDNSRVMVIGTMNGTEDLPVQIANRTSIVKIPLPNLGCRQAVLSHHLNTKVKTHDLKAPHWITNWLIAQQTNNFSHRDLENVVARATKTAMTGNKSNKTFLYKDIATIAKEIKKNQRQRLEAGTWQHAIKTHLRNSSPLHYTMGAIAATGVAGTLYFGSNSLENQTEGLKNQREGLEQTQRNADRAASSEQMAKQSFFNALFSTGATILCKIVLNC